MDKEAFYRIEIIANQAVRDDLLKEFEATSCNYFTEIPMVLGRGRQEPKQGDAIWPETNVLFVLYGDDQTLANVKTIMSVLKESYPHEGIKYFVVQARR
jgi:hypothetical protein